MRLRSIAVAALLPALLSCATQEDFGDRTMPLDRLGYGIAVSKYGVIAAANNSDYFTFDGFTLHDSVHVGGTAVHVVFTPNGLNAYGVLEYGDALVRMSVYPVREINRGAIDHELYNLALSPTVDAVFITTADGWLLKADPVTLQPLDSLQLASASNGLAFAPGGARLYVSTIAAGRLYAIDPTNLAVVDSFDVGHGAQRIAVAPSGDSVYVANEDLSGVNVVRPSTHTITDLAVTGLPYGLALSADGSRLIVALRASGEVAVFDRATLAPRGRFQIGGIPRNVAVDPAGGFVAVSTETNVVKLW